MKGSFVRFLRRHSNSGCRVCHIAEAAHGIQGVDAKSIVVVRFRRILPVPARSGGGRLTERTPAVQFLRRINARPSKELDEFRRTPRFHQGHR